MKIDISLEDLAAFLGTEIPRGSSPIRIRGLASLADARPGDLAFFSDLRRASELAATQASAVLVPRAFPSLAQSFCCIGVDNPSEAFEQVTETFGRQPLPFEAGIHVTAVVGECEETDLDGIKIGPHAVIEDGVKIGAFTEIGAGCFVGRGSVLGQGCRLFPNSTVHEYSLLGDRVVIHSGAVIGADGFGYSSGPQGHRKIRQAGYVQIDDDVEIGAASTIDRARFGRTWIGAGTKIDNQVQIGHNVVIGKHCLVVAGAGIAGSSRLGDFVILAAQAGVIEHVSIGSGCIIGARSGVTKSLPAKSGAYLGFPAVPAAEEKRRLAVIRRLASVEKKPIRRDTPPEGLAVPDPVA